MHTHFLRGVNPMTNSRNNAYPLGCLAKWYKTKLGLHLLTGVNQQSTILLHMTGLQTERLLPPLMPDALCAPCQPPILLVQA